MSVPRGTIATRCHLEQPGQGDGGLCLLLRRDNKGIDLKSKHCLGLKFIASIIMANEKIGVRLQI